MYRMTQESNSSRALKLLEKEAALLEEMEHEAVKQKWIQKRNELKKDEKEVEDTMPKEFYEFAQRALDRGLTKNEAFDEEYLKNFHDPASEKRKREIQSIVDRYEEKKKSKKRKDHDDTSSSTSTKRLYLPWFDYSGKTSATYIPLYDTEEEAMKDAIRRTFESLFAQKDNKNLDAIAQKLQDQYKGYFS